MTIDAVLTDQSSMDSIDGPELNATSATGSRIKVWDSQERPVSSAVYAMAFPTMHLSWGFGLLSAMITSQP